MKGQSTKLLCLIVCEETSLSFMNLRTAVLEKHWVFCLSTSFISNASIQGFKALRKSNHNIIWRKTKITRYRRLNLRIWRQIQENKCIKTCIKLYRYLNKAVTFFISAKGTFWISNNPWLILSSLQGR